MHILGSSACVLALLLPCTGCGLFDTSELPTLDSGDMQLLILSDKTVYKLGETPRITAQIINRSEKDTYFLSWFPWGPREGLQVSLRRPPDAPPPEYPRLIHGWPGLKWGGSNWNFNVQFSLMRPGDTVGLSLYNHIRPEMFNAPGAYEIQINYTNQGGDFDGWLSSAEESPRVFGNYRDGNGTGT